MPDSITVGRDFVQTIKGMSGAWVFGIVGLVVLGFVLIVYLAFSILGDDPDPIVVSLPPSSAPIVVPTDTPVPTPTALVQPTALPTATVAPTITVVAQVLPPAPIEIPGPTTTSIPVPDVQIAVPQVPLNFDANKSMPLTGVKILTRDRSRNYEVRIDWGDRTSPEAPSLVQNDGTVLAVHSYSESNCYQVTISVSDPVLDPEENALLICVGAVSLPTPTPTPPPAATSTPVPPGVTVPPTATPSPTPIPSPTPTPRPASPNAPTGISYQVSAGGDVVLNWTPATSSGGPVIKTFIEIEGKPGLIELYGETTSLAVIPNGYFGFGSHRMRLASANDSGVGQWSDWTGISLQKLHLLLPRFRLLHQHLVPHQLL